MFTVMLAMLTGCTASFVEAPYDAFITAPSDVVLGWSDTLNQFDLAGYPLVVEFLVQRIDPITGITEPLPHIRLDISSNGSGVYLMPEEAVELVGYPGVPDNIQSIDDVRATCVDENGNYALVEEWCAWFWDANGAQFYSFAGTYADAFTTLDSGELYFYAPNFVVTQTDRRGVARLMALVDYTITDTNSFISSTISASSGNAGDTMTISFSGTIAESTDTTDTSGGSDTGG